jgi:hypothetical protein
LQHLQLVTQNQHLKVQRGANLGRSSIRETSRFACQAIPTNLVAALEREVFWTMT